MTPRASDLSTLEVARPSGLANAARLSMLGITKRFGGTPALDNVDFEVAAGEIHALVGQNGAGKSTLMKIVAGDYTPDSGVVMIDGDKVEIRNPRQGLDAGVGIVYQELSLLPNMTIAENISLGREQARLGVVARDPARKLAERALASLGIDRLDINTRVSRLSLAQQQIVEIAKVMSYGPRVLVLDEPTAALSLDDTRRLFSALRHLRESGVAIVFVSHRYGEVLEICDRCTVLRNGKVVGREAVASLTLERLVELTLGELAHRSYHAADRARNGPTGAKESSGGVPLLRVDHLGVGSTVLDVSFQVDRGELVGLCGLLGSGQSEVARALFGDAPEVRGTVALDGHVVRLSSPRAAARQGIAFITENRRDEGIFPDLAVVPNVTAASLRDSWLAPLVPLLSPGRERARSRKVTDQVGVPRAVEGRRLRLLSGGTQQKVVVARWLAKGSKLLVCNEPTRGVDIGARADIYGELRDLADKGTGIVIVTTDIEEALVLCDRVIVCFAGRVSAVVDPREATEESLFLAMQGLGRGSDENGS
ncbi:MAG: sugar ABC transporter ATP-binding protein [Acidimicrobiales bacterium]|jgi:ABC-type sugar transport system ATPase subunit